jgi:hypothetical protein
MKRRPRVNREKARKAPRRSHWVNLTRVSPDARRAGGSGQRVQRSSITDIRIRGFESHSLRHIYITPGSSVPYIERKMPNLESAGNILPTLVVTSPPISTCVHLRKSVPGGQSSPPRQASLWLSWHNRCRARGQAFLTEMRSIANTGRNNSLPLLSSVLT